MIPTRTAGAVEFDATLTWRTLDERPQTSILDSLRCSPSVQFSLTEADDRDCATRRISGEILALGEPELSLALDEVLRTVSETSSVTGAILEIRVVRRAEPRKTPGRTRERLAHDLRGGGFSVHFRPLWAPVVGTDFALGTGGARKEIEAFLAHHPAWVGMNPTL